jgi:uncharacterized membrane protein YczE
VLQLESGLGLGPWDVLNQGISELAAISFGTANVVVALVVLGVAWLLGARIGIGTVANAILIGVFVDLLLDVEAIAALSERSLALRVALLVVAILVVGVGSGFYLGAGMGAGPRDSLMLVGSRRTGVRIGVVRAALEVSVAAVGLALGGTVGIGTIAFAFGIGPAVELAFAALVRIGLATSHDGGPDYDRPS